MRQGRVDSKQGLLLLLSSLCAPRKQGLIALVEQHSSRLLRVDQASLSSNPRGVKNVIPPAPLSAREDLSPLRVHIKVDLRTPLHDEQLVRSRIQMQLAAKDLIEERCGQECVRVLLQLRERCGIEQGLVLEG